MSKVDLHLHTTFSDGKLTPTELVKLCSTRGLNTIAITDHDSTEGVAEALQAAKNLTKMSIIVGVGLLRRS